MNRSETIGSVMTFAAQRLGPQSHAALQSPVQQTRVLARIREGRVLEDSVLAEIHRAASEDRRIADEFVGYVLSDLLRSARGNLGSGLRRFLDTGDLVQSVLGDVWSELSRIRFESRAPFLSLLSLRVRRKIAGHARAERSQRRGGGRRLDVDPADLPLPDGDPGPAVLCARQEGHERMIVVLLRLESRDREALTRFLRGEAMDEIAGALGLSTDSTRKVVQRATLRARKLMRLAEGESAS
jgi:DNA-directed RNA polymerase specialized sigma24 family protein